MWGTPSSSGAVGGRTWEGSRGGGEEGGGGLDGVGVGRLTMMSWYSGWVVVGYAFIIWRSRRAYLGG